MDSATIKHLINEHEIEYVKVGTPDIEGVYRGKRVAGHYFLHALNHGFAICDVLFGWDIAENVLPHSTVSGWERGFADFVMKPDLSTFAKVPWEERVASCICDLWTEQGGHVSVSPRYILQKVVEHARSLGYEPMAAAELEFRIFRENQMSLREKDFGTHLTPLNPGMNCYAISQASADDRMIGHIAHMMHAYGIDVEGYNREHGPGMYEMNLHYTDVMGAADQALLFKTGVKELCYQMGHAATFMAKWNDQEDGSSGHVHVSLWDRNRERNLFWDTQREGRISETMRQFVAGVVKFMPELLALYAPVVNSYKRYREGTWVPLNATWGMDNRTCAVRIINNSEGAIRLENRVPGADANFYLVFAAMLASGLYGIEHHLEPPACFQGNAYDRETVAHAIEADDIRPFARNLTNAVDLLERSAVAKEFLGADFIEHFVATRRWEVSEYEKNVSHWERRRYFELI